MLELSEDQAARIRESGPQDGQEIALKGFLSGWTQEQTEQAFSAEVRFALNLLGVPQEEIDEALANWRPPAIPDDEEGCRRLLHELAEATSRWQPVPYLREHQQVWQQLLDGKRQDWKWLLLQVDRWPPRLPEKDSWDDHQFWGYARHFLDEQAVADWQEASTKAVSNRSKQLPKRRSKWGKPSQQELMESKRELRQAMWEMSDYLNNPKKRRERREQERAIGFWLGFLAFLAIAIFLLISS